MSIVPYACCVDLCLLPGGRRNEKKKREEQASQPDIRAGGRENGVFRFVEESLFSKISMILDPAGATPAEGMKIAPFSGAPYASVSHFQVPGLFLEKDLTFSLTFFLPSRRKSLSERYNISLYMI